MGLAFFHAKSYSPQFIKIKSWLQCLGADVITVEHIVEQMEVNYGQANRIWVMDQDMVSESDLDYLQSRNATYIVGIPKSQLKQWLLLNCGFPSNPRG